jgi:predicted TIM-barrel fold metal-dependent hydrolase
VTKKVDLENHFASESWVEALRANQSYPRLVDDSQTRYRMEPVEGAYLPYGLLDKLVDLGEGRIKLLDDAGIDKAVLSLAAPGTEPFPPSVGTRVARETNDVLAEAVARYPDRYEGYATLAPKDVDSAVAELQRAVEDLGFTGWNTHSNFGDSFLDEKRFWPLLGKAEELDIPIYLHPTYPIVPQFVTHGMGVAGPSFGFGAETSLVVMRMIVGGVFDVFPRLKLILGHYGEGFPFMLDRVDRPYLQGHVPVDPGVAPELKRMPSDYIRDNIFSSTSGNYSPQAFSCTRDSLGTERMVLGTDYPFESMKACMEFLEQQPMDENEKDALYWRTAASLGMGG